MKFTSACRIAAVMSLTISCGGAAPRASAPATAGPTQNGATPTLLAGDPRSEIAALDARIVTNLDKLQIPVATVLTPLATQIANVVVPPVPQTCRQSTKPVCTDSCTLGAAICDDAGKLCELAKQLSPDAWATDKCQRAQQSCSDATKRCCDCH
ncbi:MAG TPA: hypothetical protein PLF40_00730 [Kofleriaceae bacterium]|nr:hypothetical protein [Kofleriaceae bacterium]